MSKIINISQIDKDVRALIQIYSAARIKVGLTLAEKLIEIEDNKLFSRLDERAYPTFAKYVESLGISYRTARDVMTLYETYVLTAGYTIDELSEIPYTKLSAIKGHLFGKEHGKYKLLKSPTEVKKWVKEISSDITIEDVKQHVREEESGEHEHQFDIIKFKKCRICGLKEYTN